MAGEPVARLQLSESRARSARRDGRWRRQRVAHRRRRGAGLLLRGCAVGGVAALATGRIGPASIAVVVVLVVAIAPTPAQRQWRRSARDHRSVDQSLDELGRGSRALHHRRVTGTSVTVGHLLVAPSGVWTVHVHRSRARPAGRRRRPVPVVDRRVGSRLVEECERQADAVRWVLDGAGMRDVPVRTALCLVGVRWSYRAGRRALDGPELLTPSRLPRLLAGERPLSLADVARVTALLDRTLERLQWTSSQRLLHGSSGFPSTPTTDEEDRPAPAAPDAPGSAPVVRERRRAGRRRLYVRTPTGEMLGYVDLGDNLVVAVAARHRDVVAEAAARYLRDRLG